MKSLAILVMVLAVQMGWAEDAKPATADDHKIAALVKQLGHEDWRLREKATEALDTIGRPALEAVKTAAHSKDAEVKARAVKILEGWRGYLGIFMTQHGVNVQGVLVTEVMADTPAERAGLQAGDVVLALDGKRMQSTQELITQVMKRVAGERVELTILRAGEEKKMIAELGRRPIDLLPNLKDE